MVCMFGLMNMDCCLIESVANCDNKFVLPMKILCVGVCGGSSIKTSIRIPPFLCLARSTHFDRLHFRLSCLSAFCRAFIGLPLGRRPAGHAPSVPPSARPLDSLFRAPLISPVHWPVPWFPTVPPRPPFNNGRASGPDDRRGAVAFRLLSYPTTYSLVFFIPTRAFGSLALGLRGAGAAGRAKRRRLRALARAKDNLLPREAVGDGRGAVLDSPRGSSGLVRPQRVWGRGCHGG